jgi:FOG: WD40 repeat
MKTGEKLACFKGHDGAILDVIEILNPLCIASASLDGNILLWDLGDQKNIGCLSGKHARGVRSIDYSSEYGGNIVSVGYERDIHV